MEFATKCRELATVQKDIMELIVKITALQGGSDLTAEQSAHAPTTLNARQTLESASVLMDIMGRTASTNARSDFLDIIVAKNVPA